MRLRSLILVSFVASTLAAEESKPLFKDFMGVNGHTVQFKPELYKSVCRLVRDYHRLSGTSAMTARSRPRSPKRATA